MSFASSIAVVGAGISGLSAALTLAAGTDLRVTVYDSAPRAGGCLSRTDLGGHLPGGTDDGAEASLLRRPETRDLMAELGLDPVHPSPTQSSRILTPAGLAAIPHGTLMGVPGDPEALRGVISDAGVNRAAAETLTDPVDGDVSCGDFLAARLGDEVVDTLIDPLVGGVYAGRCRELSLAATVPALLPAARAGTSVLAAVRDVLASRAQAKGADIPGASGGSGQPPVFCSLAGGISGLVPALMARLEERGVEIRCSSPVRALAEESGGERPRIAVHTDSGTDLHDRVMLAVPAWAASELLAAGRPGAGRGRGSKGSETALHDLTACLGRIDHASSAVITALLDSSGGRSDSGGGGSEGAGAGGERTRLTGSGFLVPPAAGSLVKASTFSSNKWPWLGTALPAGRHVVRMSVGRAGDAEWQELTDAELTTRAMTEWRSATGYAGRLVHSQVHRWHRALPQYAPGHGELVESIGSAVSRVPWLALTGSYVSGVGIPACIGQARRAAAALLSDMGARAGQTAPRSPPATLPPHTSTTRATKENA